MDSMDFFFFVMIPVGLVIYGVVATIFGIVEDLLNDWWNTSR